MSRTLVKDDIPSGRHRTQIAEINPLDLQTAKHYGRGAQFKIDLISPDSGRRRQMIMELDEVDMDGLLEGLLRLRSKP